MKQTFPWLQHDIRNFFTQVDLNFLFLIQVNLI
jgi:hypothetical protein